MSTFTYPSPPPRPTRETYFPASRPAPPRPLNEDLWPVRVEERPEPRARRRSTKIRRSTKKGSTKIKIRWADVAVAGAVSVVTAGLAVWAFSLIPDVAPAPAPAPAVVSEQAADYPDLNLPACPTEDSDNCYWDASFGNGDGTSFITIGGVTYYPESVR